jgi:hypothetical protein
LLFHPSGAELSDIWRLSHYTSGTPTYATTPKQTEKSKNSSQSRVLAKPSTHAADLLAQEAIATVVKITGVKLNPTATGIEVGASQSCKNSQKLS